METLTSATPVVRGRKALRVGPGDLVALIACLLLSAVALRWYQPPLPYGYELDVVFRPAGPGAEPLITSGEPGHGDFLLVRYGENGDAMLGHERWGKPAAWSKPFPLRPGETHRLRLEVSAFAQIRGGTTVARDHVRVHLDGQLLLDTPVDFHLRKGSRLYFGENPLGGSSCGPTFSGVLRHLDGRELRGNARHVFSARERLTGWLTDGRWQGISILLVSIGIGLGWKRLPARPGAALAGLGRRSLALLRTHAAFVGSAALCTTAFAYVIGGYGGPLWFPESFGNFYDYQALALLHSRLDLPPTVLSGEAFLVGGKYLGYFGVTPALLRLPLAMFDLGIGWWSRTFMIGEYLLALGAAYAVLRIVVRWVSPERNVPAAWMVILFTLNVGLGCSLFFMASRAYTYHEAALCGAAFALAAVVCTLRHWSAPASRWWIGALICGLLSLHSRPPVGLFALVLLACTGLAILLRHSWERLPVPQPWLHLALPVICFVGVLSFNALSYLKFGTFDGAPLKYHVQYHPERLDNIQGRNFHLSNLRYDATIYVGRLGFELRKTFPYFYNLGMDPRPFRGARIDLAEPTASLPASMPGLVLLALASGAACWRWRPVRWPTVVALAAIIPMAAAMLTAVAVSQRYTTDFCPWLVLLAALGLTAAERLANGARRALVALLVPVTAVAIWANVAMTLHYQGAGVWGVPPEVTQRYQALRKQVDGFFGVPNHDS